MMMACGFCAKWRPMCLSEHCLAGTSSRKKAAFPAFRSSRASAACPSFLFPVECGLKDRQNGVRGHDLLFIPSLFHLYCPYRVALAL